MGDAKVVALLQKQANCVMWYAEFENMTVLQLSFALSLVGKKSQVWFHNEMVSHILSNRIHN
jgi:hypothetical protein